MQEKSQIESIIPLTLTQNAYLMHSLTTEVDQGLLHVRCSISGDLNIQILQEAWCKVIERHSALRSSVHWDKIKKPVQVTFPVVELPWTLLDFSDFSKEELDGQINKYLENEIRKNFTLTKAPLYKVTLLKIEPDEYKMIWSCHHIIIDGWSVSIVLMIFSNFMTC